MIQDKENVIASDVFALTLAKASPVVQETSDGICFISQLEPLPASLTRLQPLIGVVGLIGKGSHSRTAQAVLTLIITTNPWNSADSNSATGDVIYASH